MKTEYADDIYFQKEYGMISEFIEKGTSQTYEFESSDGAIQSMFIVREIPFLIDGRQYYDLITPYGYGGPVIKRLTGEKERLLREYEAAFQEYCNEHDIISEFVRFHPMAENGPDFAPIYHSEMIRHTVGTNLKDYDDPVQSEFSKESRKKIRRLLKNGMEFKITKGPINIDQFKKAYYATMDRNKAMEFYYFTDQYYKSCIDMFRENTVLVETLYKGETIAAGYYFIWNKAIHTHLSGTLTEYLFLSPEYILNYAITVWGKEHGYEMIHRGGGRSSAPDDTLYTFKKQFGRNTEFDFYIGRRIWNQTIYRRAVEIKESQTGKSDADYFPQYRGKVL